MKPTLTFIISFLISLTVYGQEAKIIHLNIDSKYLNETRELTIYLPKTFKQNKKYDVIYNTDGQFIDQAFKTKVDSLFSSKNSKEFIIIGVNSNEKEIPNSRLQYRNYEYIEKNSNAKDPELGARFKKHLDFFVSEVGKNVQKQLQFKIKNRYFYGTSNGAGFGVSLSKYYPDMFKKYILYSVAGENYQNLNWNSKNYPLFIIRYGDKEFEPLVQNNLNLSKYLNEHHYKHIMSSYEGNHKKEDWLNQFVKDVNLLK